MKIRSRSGATLRGEKEVPVLMEQEAFYIVASLYGYEALPKSQWEPVPAKAWRDVTAECEWEGERLYHVLPQDVGVGRRVVVGTGCDLFNGYRLRKVQFRDLYYENKYDAFIIECLS